MNNVRKVSIISIVLIMCLLSTACGQKNASQSGDDQTGGEPLSQMVNPMAEYGSLDEINEAVGVKLYKFITDGVSEQMYFVISAEIADYRFSAGGCEYDFRASKKTDTDISGVYIGGGEAFKDMAAEFQIAGDGEYKVCRMLAGDIQYTISVKDDGKIPEADFETLCRGIFEELTK